MVLYWLLCWFCIKFVFGENDEEDAIVDVKGDVKLADDVKKVIVFRQNDQIHIFKCEEDVEEGMMVNLGPNPEETPETPQTEQ